MIKPSNYLEDFNKAIHRAQTEGFAVVRGNETTVLLDLDDDAAKKHFDRALPILKCYLKTIRVADRWKSKSGVGEHVILELGRPLPVTERLLIQCILGSDRIHELLSLTTGVWLDNPEPTVLFKPSVKELAA